MAVNVNYCALYKDTWGMGKIKPTEKGDQILGIDVKTVNIEVEVEGPEFPSSIEVEVRTREPGNKTGGQTSVKTPLKFQVPRSGKSKWYLINIPLKQISDFLLAEGPSSSLEFATVVRKGGNSDQGFRQPLVGAKWASRGVSTQALSNQEDTTDVVKEYPNAKRLFLAGGLEILEVKVAAKPGINIKNGTDWAFVQSPCDVMFYSGHGLKWTGELARDPSFDGWTNVSEILDSWQMKGNANAPCDLDCLVINGCSVLYWDVYGQHLDPEPKFKGRPNIALDWARLLCNQEGPLWTMLGYRLKAPTDVQGGYLLAQKMAKEMVALGAKWEDYAPAWLRINSQSAVAKINAAAVDVNGYWMYDLKAQKVVGPIPIPKGGSYMNPPG